MWSKLLVGWLRVAKQNGQSNCRRCFYLETKRIYKLIQPEVRRRKQNYFSIIFCMPYWCTFPLFWCCYHVSYICIFYYPVSLLISGCLSLPLHVSLVSVSIIHLSFLCLSVSISCFDKANSVELFSVSVSLSLPFSLFFSKYQNFIQV